MVAVVNKTGNNDIDGILWGWKWDSTDHASPGVVNFSFPTGSAEYTNNGYGSVTGFQAFNETQKNAVRQTFAMINSYVTQFTAVETGPGGVALFRYAEADAVDYTNNNTLATYNQNHNITTAEANPPELGFNGNPPFAPRLSQGDSWYNHTSYNNPVRGSFAMQAGIMHETGHNMGLKHGHVTQNGHGVTFPQLPADHNSYEYSIMTYSQYVGDDPGNGDNAPHHATTYMIDDIAALQYMYGADFATQNGNTSYSWVATSGAFYMNGAFQSQGVGNYVLMSIWDGGGNDTYNLSNFASNLVINLAPGGAGIVMPGLQANLGDGHFARANVYNTYLFNGNTASLIENAYGGGGSDAIYGNQVANLLYGQGANDALLGYAGADVLDGGGGNDTIYGGNDNDYMLGGAGTDALVGDAGNDQIAGQGDNDAIAGGAGSDSIDGGDGNDTLWGHDSTGVGDLADLILGGNGNDTIIGFEGNDQLFGGNNDDLISGGNGADVVQGDAGNDSLYGGASTDAFKFTAMGFGADNIFDFQKGQDRVYFSTTIFANFAALHAASVGNAGLTVIVKTGGGQVALHGYNFFTMSAADFAFF